MTSTTAQTTILIAGAGISGLALAQALLRTGRPFRIFEREASLDARTQGYRFRLKPEGITALEILLPPALLATVRATCAYVGPENHAFDALSAEQRPWAMRAPPGQWAVDRSVLRRALMQGLEPYVEFGRDVVRYELTTDRCCGSGGAVVAHFKDGGRAEGALLVGADGINSSVARQLLGPDKLVHLDSEGRWVWGKTVLTPQLQALFNPSAMSGLAIVQQRVADLPLSLFMEVMRFNRNDDNGEESAAVARRALLPEQDYVYWVLQAHRDIFPDDDETLLRRTPAQAHELVRAATEHWHPSFACLFAAPDEDGEQPARAAILRITTSPPAVPAWEPCSYVTLVGDAAHALSPTSGAGASTALRDVAGLFQVLERASGAVSLEAMAGFENEMRRYAGEAIEFSFVNGKQLFGLKPWQELKRV